MEEKSVKILRLWQQMQQDCSVPRTDVYKLPSDADELDPMARYLWNIDLCASLYPSCNMLEVVLRNAVHTSLSALKGTSAWYDDTRLLRPKEQEMVRRAKEELNRRGQVHDPSRMVAELMLGFWTNLFVHHYDRSIAIPILPTVFAHRSPVRLRTRRHLHPRLEDIKYIRNRVSHHEPIWHWRDLSVKHDQILETIAWISPKSRSVVTLADRFDLVYTRGWVHYREKLNLLL